MNHYEALFIVHPDQSEQVPALVEKYKDLLTQNGGRIHREEDWGRRKLAYPIHKVHKGHFVLLNAECNSAEVDELVEAFRFNDAILRHMILRKEYAPDEPSPIAKEMKQKDRGGPGEKSRGGEAGKAEEEEGRPRGGEASPEEGQDAEASAEAETGETADEDSAREEPAAEEPSEEAGETS